MTNGMKRAFAAAALGLAAGVAHGASRPPPSEENWARRPTPQDFRDAVAGIRRPTPTTAVRAAMRCHVEDSGALSGCRLIADTPPGAGFGAALLTLAPKYVRKPPGRNDLRDVNVVLDDHPVDVEPNWLKRPTPGDLRAVWPTEAWKRGQGGRAVINCVVTAQGALNDCIAIEETPGGFGGAAIALTPQLMMKPGMLKGAPVASNAVIPINFEDPGAPPPGDTLGSRKIIQPNLPWALAPSYADLVAAYPKKARDAKVAGRATMDCDMSEEGRLVHCSTVVSEPHGYGFEEAAKNLSKLFQFPVRTEAEKKITHSLSIHMPVTFDPAMLDQTSAPIIGKPSWAALPTADQVLTAFQAVKLSATARAQLNCAVQPAGGLADCKVVAETPLGAGVAPRPWR